jgi:hypothetical protein
MRIQFQIKEKMLPIFDIEKKFDLLIVGGIEILIRSILDIPNVSLEVNGIGTKIATNIKKLGISPVIYDFIGNDEFFDFINKYFEKNDITLFFSRQPYGTKRVLKLIKNNEENVYKDYRNIEKMDYNHSLNILSDVYNEVRGVYLILNNFENNIVRNVKLLGKFLFLDFEESTIIPNSKDIFGDFIFTNENIHLPENIHYIYKVTFLNDGKIKFDFSNKNWTIEPFSINNEYVFEAKCSFKSVIINSLFEGKSLKDALLLGNIAYSYSLENKGRMISKNLLFEEYYKRK